MNDSIPKRAEVPGKYKWNLSQLFASDQAWEKDLDRLGLMQAGIESYKARLAASETDFFAALTYYSEYLRLDEKLGNYASLRTAEDEGDSVARSLFARYMSLATSGQAAWAWLTPSIQALPETFIAPCMKNPRFSDYLVFLEKLIRFKPYILSEKEERILAMQAETNQIPRETFGILTNVDLDFGKIRTGEGFRPLSQSAFASLMRNKDRKVRRAAYRKFYGAYERHKTTLASLYAGSVRLDAYQAQVRGFPSARSQALFPDNVPDSVYDNLIGTINENLPVLHDYYGLRKKALGLDELRHYDVYVPFAHAKESKHSYEEAVEIVTSALAPLGDDYVETLKSGLLGGWVDRYENKGKRSGAFSAGGFAGEPYILLNYKDNVLNDLFTLAHEGGHSMHSWYSVRNNPFLCYSYTIFEAEVASTFNEQLVFDYLYERAGSDEEKASLLSTRIDDTLATLFRQTMFAEYEAVTHAMSEAGEPLTVDSLRAQYRKLLEKYFGPSMRLEKVSDLEGLRIPHFYNAFYVYKYATGVSASIALSERVLRGGASEKKEYFSFLKSGGSKFPIEALKMAGVDMSSSEPVRLACARFADDVKTLRRVLKL